MTGGILPKICRTAVSATDTGTKRENNEDSLLALDSAGFYAVSDGMGGGAAGEIASSTVVTYLRNALGPAPALPDRRRELLNTAVYAAHNAILNYAAKHGYRSMGATLVALLLDPWQPERADIYYAGDSRIYRLRGRALKCLTTDHTVANASGIPAKKLPPAIAGLLSNAIGIDRGFFLASQAVDVRENDIFLLCSDGLYRQIPEDRLERTLLKARDLSAVPAAWVKEANAQRGLDNLSAILVRFGVLPEPYHPSADEIKLNTEPELPESPGGAAGREEGDTII